MIDATEISLAYNGGKSPNGSGNYYWALSPHRFDYNFAVGYNVDSDGNGSGGIMSYFSYGVRPAVSLRAGTQYSSGDGSSDKPFVASQTDSLS